MSRNPRIIPIRDNYKELFKEEEQQAQSSEEIIRRMRGIMKVEKNLKSTYFRQPSTNFAIYMYYYFIYNKIKGGMRKGI